MLSTTLVIHANQAILLLLLLLLLLPYKILVTQLSTMWHIYV
jgi:hypothetical protein